MSSHKRFTQNVQN